MSFVVGAATGGIIAFLVTNGFTKVKEETDKIGNTIITGVRDGSPPFKVTIKNQAVISPQFDLVQVVTSQTVKNVDQPLYELKNESSVIKRIFSFSLVPDATFQNEGFVEVHLNGVKFFPITDPTQGQFSDIAAINLPIPENYGLKILPKDKLEVFAWNPSGNQIKMTIATFIGELP